MRVKTRSSSTGELWVFHSPSGLRPLKIVFRDAPSPCFSQTSKIPRGVLKLPSWLPVPNLDVETAYEQISRSCCQTSIVWLAMITLSSGVTRITRCLYSTVGERGRCGMEEGAGELRSDALASRPSLRRRALSFSTAGLAAVRSLSP